MNQIQSDPAQVPRRARILAMILMGIGLLVLGSVIFLIFPWPGASAGGNIDYSVTPLKMNFPAPDLQLHDLTGQQVSLKDYHNRVVLLNNWATWCPPCQAEMPTLNEFYQAHQQQNFTLVGIESGETMDEVANFANNYHLSFTLWLDPNGIAIDSFHNNALPSSYVIDTHGTVVLGWTGPISRAQLEKYITPMLK
jgi:peroxiredoxin